MCVKFGRLNINPNERYEERDKEDCKSHDCKRRKKIRVRRESLDLSLSHSHNLDS